MNDHAGYEWGIEERGAQWIWTIRGRGDRDAFATGAAQSRSHAAACVVHALICGMTAIPEPQSMAA